MDLLGLVREWVSIRQEKRDHCKSCLILQEQLTNALAREQKLLSVITAKPEPAKLEQVIAPQPVNRGVMPWHIKRQILEQEDRAKAEALRRQSEEAQAAKNPRNPEISQELSIQELEKELSIGGE